MPNDAEYLAQVKDILQNKAVQSMQQYCQHGETSCLEHSVNVSYLAYLYCKQHGLDARAAARAGLLHDLFLYDWHNCKISLRRVPHGFAHPRIALQNAQKEFDLTEKEKNMILRHMWPLTIVPPRYKEGFVLMWFDKYCSINEMRRQPVVALQDAAAILE